MAAVCIDTQSDPTRFSVEKQRGGEDKGFSTVTSLLPNLNCLIALPGDPPFVAFWCFCRFTYLLHLFSSLVLSRLWWWSSLLLVGELAMRRRQHPQCPSLFLWSSIHSYRNDYVAMLWLLYLVGNDGKASTENRETLSQAWSWIFELSPLYYHCHYHYPLHLWSSCLLMLLSFSCVSAVVFCLWFDMLGGI